MEIDFNKYLTELDGSIMRHAKEVYPGDSDEPEIIRQKLTVGIVCRTALNNRVNEPDLTQDKIMDRYYLARSIEVSERDKETFELSDNDGRLIQKLVKDKQPIQWVGFVIDYIKEASDAAGHNKKKKKEKK